PVPSQAGQGGLGGLAARTARRPAVVLSSLQEHIARILADLPEATEFALAGGAALIAGGLVDRETRDLDFFADRPEAILELLPVLEERLRHAGFQVERQQAQAGFARLGVNDGARSTEVDLCYDVRLRPLETTGIGAVLAPEELAADKMLAFFSRALPRDLIDLHALAQRYGFDRLCELAAEKDRGFNLQALADALRSTQRLPEDAFEVADPAAVQDLLAWAERERSRIVASGRA
ncbi:MAG: nucleotidyl transferase AbiEii/AbiGii toxin family protein, partial [Actinobacteria bacterium]|nr:nucleotidyl transferase AbiEii/AbiGii toxin family protein [Actinomycetota bacterium]